MDHETLEEETEEGLESRPQESDNHERIVSKSFKQGFGFGLGMLVALILTVLLISLLLYLAVLGGVITIEDLLLL